MSFSDADERAVKIRSGYGYSFNEAGELVVSDEKTNLDITAHLTKLKAGTASSPEIQTVLAHLLEKELK